MNPTYMPDTEYAKWAELATVSFKHCQWLAGSMFARSSNDRTRMNRDQPQRLAVPKPGFCYPSTHPEDWVTGIDMSHADQAFAVYFYLHNPQYVNALDQIASTLRV